MDHLTLYGRCQICEQLLHTSLTANPGLNERTCSALCNSPGLAPRSQVFLLPEHLAITMEYAAGGDLFQLVGRAGGLREGDGKWYFQQLIVAIDYCHRMVRTAPCKRLVLAAVVRRAIAALLFTRR